MISQKFSLKKFLFASFVINSTLLSLLIGQQPSRAESFNLVWSTDFNTPLNSGEWNIYKNAPFASSQTACFMGSNTYTQNGVLNLVINNNKSKGCSGRPYASGGLDTYTYRAQTYGRWEVRAKMPTGYGVVGYIGLFPVNGSWPPEIDFAEYVGKQPDNLFLTQHYGVWPNNQQDSVSLTDTTILRSNQHSRLSPQLKRQINRKAGVRSARLEQDTTSPAALNFNEVKPQKLKKNSLKSTNRTRFHSPKLSQKKVGMSRATTNGTSYWANDYHTYTLEWVPGELRYYIDGVLQVTQPQKFTETPNMMKLAMGTGTGDCGTGNWMGCPKEAAINGSSVSLPTQMRVDYVKIYQYIP